MDKRCKTHTHTHTQKTRKTKKASKELEDRRSDRRILEISESNSLFSMKKVRLQLLSEKDAAPTYAIRRIIKANGKHGRVARKISCVSKINMRKRMQFYEKHLLSLENFGIASYGQTNQ